MASTLRSDINITPLVDIVLVLLIVFITLLPAVPRVLSAALPGQQGEGTSAVPLLRLLLRKDGSLEVVGQPEASLAAALSHHPERILLRVHPDLPLSAPTRVLDEIKGLCPGTRVAVAAAPL